jgi:hypothetical protein
MAVLEERRVVSTGGSGVALAWLAGREPSRDRPGVWPTGGEGGAAWMARRPVICCGMLTAQVSPGVR